MFGSMEATKELLFPDAAPYFKGLLPSHPSVGTLACVWSTLRSARAEPATARRRETGLSHASAQRERMLLFSTMSLPLPLTTSH